MADEIRLEPGLEDYSNDVYYALMGTKGPSEKDLLAEWQSRADFSFMPPLNDDDDRLPAVRISKFFVVDKDGTLMSFTDITTRRLFLHGHVRAWDGNGPEQLIGHIPVEEWSFIEREDHGANFFIHGKEMKYFLETPKEEYKPYMDPPRDMVLSTLWVADEVHDNMEKYGGKYAAFKAACEGDLERARDHWEFIKAKVPEFLTSDLISSQFFRELDCDMTSQGEPFEPPEDVQLKMSDQNLYLVENALGFRTNKRTGIEEVLIKWKGYSKKTWEPITSFDWESDSEYERKSGDSSSATSSTGSLDSSSTTSSTGSLDSSSATSSTGSLDPSPGTSSSGSLDSPSTGSSNGPEHGGQEERHVEPPVHVTFNVKIPPSGGTIPNSEAARIQRDIDRGVPVPANWVSGRKREKTPYDRPRSMTNPLDLGWKPEKILEAQIVKGVRMFLVRFEGGKKARVPAQSMKEKHPQIVIRFLEKNIAVVDHGPFQPKSILGARFIAGERYYVVKGCSPTCANRTEIISGKVMNEMFSEIVLEFYSGKLAYNVVQDRR